MFESDDFDQILSQFDFPDAACSNSRALISVNKHDEDKNNRQDATRNSNDDLSKPDPKDNDISTPILSKSAKAIEIIDKSQLLSPKHTKRKMIDTYFDPKSKRKFPGPAGLLTGNIKETKDEYVCQLELLSQDVDFSQNYLHKDAFDSPLWLRLLEDAKQWNLSTVDTIKAIKQCTISGSLRKRKAQRVVAFIESVDRSITDPLITIRDSTGSIKCTLHRDAWSKFSPYVVAEYCALVLLKPTILTTGSTFKNHYLNITLSNIFAIYSSVVLEDDAIKDLPEGYVKIYEGDYTVIKAEGKQVSNSELSSSIVESTPEMNGIFEGLDGIFSDEIF